MIAFKRTHIKREVADALLVDGGEVVQSKEVGHQTEHRRITAAN
jgi:hypothetical protein